MAFCWVLMEGTKPCGLVKELCGLCMLALNGLMPGLGLCIAVELIGIPWPMAGA